jgi:hypothetical protein
MKTNRGDESRFYLDHSLDMTDVASPSGLDFYRPFKNKKNCKFMRGHAVER